MKLGQTISLILVASSAFAQTATSSGLKSVPTKLPGNVGSPTVQVVAETDAAPKKTKATAAKPKAKQDTAAPATASTQPTLKSTSQTGHPKMVTTTNDTSNNATKPKFQSVSKGIVTGVVKAKPILKSAEPKVPELTLSGRRDPFVSPIVKASGLAPTSGCDVGKKCLMVDQMALKGIVKSENGMIALVENSSHRAYFLRENDPVFNGTVVKITPDTVVFRENITDKLGKPAIREVTKKVNAPVV